MARTRRPQGLPGPQPAPRVPPDGPHGERAELEAQVAAAAPARRPTVADGMGPMGRIADALGGGVFGPSQRPDEPATAGIPFGPGSPGPGTLLPADPDQLLRAMVAVFPHPDLLALLEDI